MPRPRKGRVGQRDGVAEHLVAAECAARHRGAGAPTRAPRSLAPRSLPARSSRAVVLGCGLALALGCIPAAAGAQTSTIARTRGAIDAAAGAWFAAQQRAAALDTRIAVLTRSIADAEQHIASLRHVARARLIQVYEDSTSGFGTVAGSDALDVGRRAELLGEASADGQHAIDELAASVADLSSQRDQLRAARSGQAAALRAIADERQTLDAELAALRADTRVAAARAAFAAHTPRAPRVVAAAATDPPTPAAPTIAVPVAAAPVAPPDTGRVSPHHDDPFLVCTRMRESDGVYTAVSPSGYYGAYQFSPTTWDVTATHAGALQLVGVLPSLASAYDQDEMAWALYTWQGNAPWGGRC